MYDDHPEYLGQTAKKSKKAICLLDALSPGRILKKVIHQRIPITYPLEFCDPFFGGLTSCESFETNLRRGLGVALLRRLIPGSGSPCKGNGEPKLSTRNLAPHGYLASVFDGSWAVVRYGGGHTRIQQNLHLSFWTSHRQSYSF